MTILEDYKKKSEQLLQDLEQTNQSDSGLRVLRCMQVVGGLQKIYSYLHELIEHLNFIEPRIQIDMSLDGFGQLDNLRQGDYKLVAENNYRRESICLIFTLNNDENLELEVKESKENEEQLEKLKEHGLLANYTSRQPAIISIQGYVPVRIEFFSDFEESNIHLSINNFSRLGAEHYMLNVESISDSLLDELGRFISRQENNFMDVLIEDSQGISIARRIISEGEESEGPHTEEMDISRLRSMFNREQRLYLTYHNNIKDIGSRSHGIVLGRANDCELMVKSDLASRHHAQLVYRKGKFVLIDQSTNGSFVKPQNGKEVYVQSEAVPLSGSGFISLGKAVTVDNEHLIYYSCQ